MSEQLTGFARSAAMMAEKGLSTGARVRWSSEGRAAFALPNPNIMGTLKNPSNVSGFGVVLWDGRASPDTIDLHFIERAA